MRTYQRGQVMPLGLSLVVAGALFGLVLFNTGRVVSDKTRLVNAADAAAYSGLVWQARALNFQAYTNRAMVANQVAMAQAVSLRSWALYGKIATGNINRVLGGVPFVGALTSTMEAGMDASEKMIAPIAGGMLSVSNAVNTALSKSQTAMFASSFAATPEIIKKVVKANDSSFDSNTKYSIANQLANVKQWDSFTTNYDSTNKQALKARIDVINRSRDPFSKIRNWNVFNSYLPVFGLAKFRLEKRGETRLIEVTESDVDSNGNKRTPETNYEWKAKDTLSLQFQYFKIKRGRPRWVRVETPIGWGEALANNQAGDASIEPCNVASLNNGFSTKLQCPQWLDKNRQAEQLADNNVRGISGEKSREKISATFNGIRAYRSLSEKIELKHDPKLILRVEVAMPLTKIRSSEKIISSESFKAQTHAPGDMLTSVSTAEVYYQRPDDLLSTSNVSLTPPISASALSAYSNSTVSAQNNIQRELQTVIAKIAVTNPANSSYGQLQARQTQLQAALHSAKTTIASSNQTAVGNALGVDTANLASSLAQSGNQRTAVDKLEAYVDSKIASYDFVKLQSQFESELSNALEDAAKTIVAGAATGVLSQAQGQIADAAQTVNRINSTVQGYKDSYAQASMKLNAVKGAAEAKVAQLNIELNKVKGKLVGEFDSGKQELQDNLTAAKKPILEKIAKLQKELNKNAVLPLSVKQKNAINKRITAASIQLEGVESTHKKLAAEKVMHIVNNSTKTMRIDLQQAERLINLDKGEFQFDIADLTLLTEGLIP